MNFCIGIISYLPDGEIRRERISRCNALIGKIKEVFRNTDILVVAQNWKGEIAQQDLTAYLFDEPLSIIGARNKLRDKFLASNYDYIILFDDDCVLEGTLDDGNKLLEILRQNPGKYLVTSNQFKLCALSKEIYSRFALPPLCVENGSGIEDMAYFKTLNHDASELQITGVDLGSLKETSVWVGDLFSTWSRKDILLLIRKTKDFLAEKGIE